MKNLQKVLTDKKKVVFGKEKNLKLLENGALEKVFLSSNFPEIEKVRRLSALSDTEVIVLDHTSDELGAISRKSFFISIIGLRREN